MTALKVGELAKRTGLSIRTLHYYDEIGLLTPANHTETGHRLYSVEDIGRLQRILSLRQIGFSLEDIRSCLDQPDFSAQAVIQLHLTHLKTQLALQQRLVDQLETIAAHLSESVSADEFLQMIEVTQMMEKYYNPEQLEELKQRRDELNADQIRQTEAEWQMLIDRVRLEMLKGTDPTADSVRELAQQWLHLIQTFTGGDPAIDRSLATLYQQEGPEVASHGVVDAAVFEYMGRAIGVLKGGG